MQERRKRDRRKNGNGHLSANPHAPVDREEQGPLRPPRPALGLRLLPDGRTALPEGNPCEGCDHCCRYVSIQIDRPTTKHEFDNVRWYLLHKNVSVMIDYEGDWLIQFDTPCRWLVDGRCTHYELRPEICRDYDPAECERYAGPAEKVLLRTPEDLARYLDSKKKKKKRVKR
jgi:Fe-S-cluster containining protein